MSYITKVRERSPLIFNIMNEVASNFSANGLIAVGASPSISNTPKEANELGEKANAVVLNLGTLSEDRAEAMMLAGESANKAGVPVILDPIAIGATEFRTKVIYDILSNIEVAVICANASEIAVLGGALEKTNSPDNLLEKNDPKIAMEVAKKYNTVVVSTGEVDVITDGYRTVFCENGHVMLQNITTSGCLLTSIIAAFISVSDGEVFEASVEAVSGYGTAAEKAMEKVAGPGSFIPAFLDQLYFLTEETITTHQKIVDINKTD